MGIEEEFRVLWQFPHCVGALDGKHVNFRPPREAGSFFRNYKGMDSIVLMALVDAKYRFIYVDIGRNGRMNDGSVFKESSFARALNSGLLNIPPPMPLPNYLRNVSIPYMIVADDAFSLTTSMMKPFKNRCLSHEERIFNYRLSRARRVVENAFGILANRFRVLLRAIPLSVEKVEMITMTCCILHNFILIRKPIPLATGAECSGSVENSDYTLRGVRHQGATNATDAAKNIRHHLKVYFNTVYKVEWQDESVAKGNY